MTHTFIGLDSRRVFSFLASIKAVAARGVCLKGQGLLSTARANKLEDARFVVWLNPFWGPVALDGKTFEQMKVYQDIKKRIETVVNLPAFTDELFPQDIASMLNSRLTFKEAIESPNQSLMSRHRLKVAQREFYSRLDSLAV